MANTSIKELSTENIRSRMVKNAARIWSVESDDIESTFDPLVTMLIEACAFELSKVNNEILDSQSRILERLAQVLSPETFTGPQPAYAVAHARASEPEGLLRREVQFCAQQKIIAPDQKEINKDIYFSPVRPMKIFDAAIKYMAVGKSIFEYKSPSSKQLVEGASVNSLDPYNVWIGIEMSQKINTLNNFTFYFDWKNDPEKDGYLSVLPLTKWFFNAEEIKAVKGISQDDVNEANSKSIADQYNASLRTEKYIDHIFANNFFTLHAGTSKPLQACMQPFPAEFEQVFPKDVLGKIQGSFLWLKLIFPGAMKLSALNDLYITMNAIPVINRRVNKITYQLRSNLNIVPLKTDETFFDLMNVQNTEGAFFQSNPLESGFKNEAGFYTLRYGGIERFDKRSASEFLQTLIDLLRDESASFSSLGNEFVNSYINMINQSIAMIENRLNTKGEFNKPSHFIIINPIRQNENVFIKFWSTCGADGNLVKAGTKMSLAAGNDIKSATIMLLTSSTGGKKPLNENEKITAFRRSILTHDRIVTQEDIVTFCYHEMGNLIASVEVRKTWQPSLLPKQAMVRILEVHVVPKPYQKISSDEWQNLATELQVKIEDASNKLIPLKVIIHQKL